MKGGGGTWVRHVMYGGTSRHGRHDVGTPELSFKYILQGLSVPNQPFGRLCKHTQDNEYNFPSGARLELTDLIAVFDLVP